MERIITKLMQKERELRYSSARELRADLERLKEQLKKSSLLSTGRLSRVGDQLWYRYRGFLLLLLALAAVVSMSYSLLFRMPQPVRSMAVLPFVNTTGREDLEYLFDGIAESIIYDLGRLPFLKVVSRALDLDGSLAEAYSSLGFVRLWYDWDWPGAEVAFRQAIGLNPSYATAYQWYADSLVVMGRRSEALAAVRKALELDPLYVRRPSSSCPVWGAHGSHRIAAGRREIGTGWVDWKLLRGSVGRVAPRMYTPRHPSPGSASIG